jgi:nucleoside-diphosphate-sugar epimerase
MKRRLLVTGGSGFIGSNFMDALLDRDEEVLNLDLAAPEDERHLRSFRQTDLLDRESVSRVVLGFKPTHVVHFAGRTDMIGASIEDYVANHVGTANLLAVLRESDSLQQVVFTSSQFVVGPGHLPRDVFDYRPHTIYGESKVLSEQAIWKADLAPTWTIIRPTNIWGPRHPRYPQEFWRVLKQGRYFHPGGCTVRRCYGYVGNVVEQIFTILAAERAQVDRKVFYVGDDAIELIEWTNAFSRALTGRPVRVAPRSVVRGMALLGDALVACGAHPPLYTSRFQSMTQDYLTPMRPTFEALGKPKISLEEGVRATVEWLQRQDPFWSLPAQRRN